MVTAQSVLELELGKHDSWFLQNLHCSGQDETCKIVGATLCVDCIAGATDPSCGCHERQEPHCVPTSPTGLSLFVRLKSKAPRQMPLDNRYSPTVPVFLFVDCTHVSQSCDMDCPLGYLVDFSGCKLCQCVELIPHYCRVCGNLNDWPSQD